jgi:hypothetical protein
LHERLLESDLKAVASGELPTQLLGKAGGGCQPAKCDETAQAHGHRSLQISLHRIASLVSDFHGRTRFQHNRLGEGVLSAFSDQLPIAESSGATKNVSSILAA